MKDYWRLNDATAKRWNREQVAWKDQKRSQGTTEQRKAFGWVLRQIVNTVDEVQRDWDKNESLADVHCVNLCKNPIMVN